MSTKKQKKYVCPECGYDDGDPLEVHAHVAIEHGHISEHIETVNAE